MTSRHGRQLSARLLALAAVAAALFATALAASYESLRTAKLPAAHGRPRRRSSAAAPAFDPRADQLHLVRGFNCSNPPGRTARAWADDGAAMLANFTQATEALPADGNIPPGVLRDMDAAVLATAQRFHCAVQIDPDHTAYLRGLADALSRARARVRVEQAAAVLQRCVLQSPFTDAELLHELCVLKRRLHDGPGGRRAANACLAQISALPARACASGPACRALARALKAMGRPLVPDQLVALERAFQLAPADPTASVQLQTALLAARAQRNDSRARQYRAHRQQFVGGPVAGGGLDLVSILDAAEATAAAAALQQAKHGAARPRRCARTAAAATQHVSLYDLLQHAAAAAPPATNSAGGVGDSDSNAGGVDSGDGGSDDGGVGLVAAAYVVLKDVHGRAAAMDVYRHILSDSLVGATTLCDRLRDARLGAAGDGSHVFARLLLHVVVSLMEQGQINSTGYPLRLHEPYAGPARNDTHFHLLWGESGGDLDVSKYDVPLAPIMLAQALCPGNSDVDASLRMVPGGAGVDGLDAGDDGCSGDGVGGGADAASEAARRADAELLRRVWLMDRPGVVALLARPPPSARPSVARATDGFGTTALQYAVANGDAGMLATLLRFTAHGAPAADVHATDMFGNSAATMVAALPRDVPWCRHMQVLLQAYETLGAGARGPAAGDGGLPPLAPGKVFEEAVAAVATAAAAAPPPSPPPSPPSSPPSPAVTAPAPTTATTPAAYAVPERPGTQQETAVHPAETAVTSVAGATGWTTLQPGAAAAAVAAARPPHAGLVDARNTSLLAVVRDYVATGRPVVIRNALGACPALAAFSRDRLGHSQLATLRFRVVDGRRRSTRRLAEFVEASMPPAVGADDATLNASAVAAAAVAWKARICRDNAYIAHHLEAGWQGSRAAAAAHQRTEAPARMEPVSGLLECIPYGVQEYFQLAAAGMPGAWMQWALTIGSCSGAQWHFHEAAVNVQVFGTKRWFLYPPARSTSNKQMRSGKWFEDVYPTLAPHERPMEFVQGPGDIVVLPRYAAHATMCAGECASIFWVQSAFGERPNAMGPLADFLWSPEEHRYMMQAGVLLTDEPIRAAGR